MLARTENDSVVKCRGLRDLVKKDVGGPVIKIRHNDVGPSVVVQIRNREADRADPGRIGDGGLESTISIAEQNVERRKAVIRDHEIEPAVAVEIGDRQAAIIGP